MILLIIFLSYWFSTSLKQSYIVFGVLLIVLFIYIYKKLGKKALILSFIVSGLGVGISHISFDIKKDSYTGYVVESKDNYIIFQSLFEKFYYYEKNNDYEIGDLLTINGSKEELDFVTLESQFNFEKYLNNKGIKYQLIAKKITRNFANPLKLKAYKKYFLSKFNDEKSKNLVSSILFSEVSDDDVTGLLSSLHVIKLVSASGFYIYLFLHFIEYFVSIKIKKKYSTLVSLILLSSYLIFTFPRFTVIRVFFSILLNWLNEYKFNNRFNKLETTSILALLFLFIDYHYGYQDSFILGFTIPLFTYLFKDFTNNLKPDIKRIVNGIGLFFFFIPFELKFYNCLSPLSNLFGIMLSPIMTIFGVFSLLSFYGMPLQFILKFFTQIIEILLKIISIVSIEIYAPGMVDILMLIYYIMYFSFLYSLSGYVDLIFKIVTPLFSSFLITYFLPIENAFINKVSFINVGQGDCCLIQKGYSSIMIDTGGLKYTDIAKNTLIPYLKKNRIYKIDYLITTHDDFDHAGAASTLIDNFNVKNYITSYKDFPININGITFTNYNTHIDELEDDNDKSLVIGYNLHNRNYLIMGDAPISVEKNIIKENPYLKCDILKAGHHGSKTSSSEEFIKFVHPKEAIISVGKNNYYGHPNKEVIDILNENHIKIRRTDIEGTIIYKNYIFM